MKQVILFLSGKSDFCTIKKFDKLSIMNRDDANDTIFLYHQKEQEVPDTIKSVPHYTFTSDILHNMGYTPIGQQLLPGSNHFPLLKFYLSHPNYDYYWLIEDDVYFNGNWDSFFNLFTTHLLTLFQHIWKFIRKSQNGPGGRPYIQETNASTITTRYILSIRYTDCLSEHFRISTKHFQMVGAGIMKY